jgi:hypothetical protein
LPDEFERIYTFKYPENTKKLSLLNAKENAFAYAGFYVKLYIKDFPLEIL